MFLNASNRTAIDNWLQTDSRQSLTLTAQNTYLKRLVYQIVNEPYVVISWSDPIQHGLLMVDICCRKYNGFIAVKPLDKKHMHIKKLTEETRKSRSELVDKVCI
jgi:hypothetical protein